LSGSRTHVQILEIFFEVSGGRKMKMLSSFWMAFKSPTSMAILAIVGFGLAIFQGFFYEKKGELTITNDAVSRVFDIHQPVGGLEVSYAGENLRTSKKALWALSFTVRNSGNAEIRKADYDDQVPFGFQFVGAEIVEIPTIKTNVEYLSQNLKISKTPNFVRFSPVIFEPNDEVQVNVLLLGSDTVKPIFFATGKIAGLRSITMSSPDQKDSGRSVLAKITDADALWVHPARSVIYGFGGLVVLSLVIALLAGVSAPLNAFSNGRAVSKRRKEIATYKANEALDSNSRSLIDIYAVDGEEAILEIAQIIETVKRRTALVAEIKESVSPSRLENILRRVHPLRPSSLFRKLKDLGLIYGSKTTIAYSEALDNTVEEVALFFKIDLKGVARRADLSERMVSMEDGSDFHLRIAFDEEQAK
jgi:hypothetical protein